MSLIASLMPIAHDWKMLLYLFVLALMVTLYKEWQRSQGSAGLVSMLWNALCLYAPLIGLAGLAAYAGGWYVVLLSFLLLGVYIFLAMYDAKQRKKE